MNTVALSLITALAVFHLQSCKTRQNGSAVKGIKDVEKTETSDDNKVWVWCKKSPPRSHNGKCRFTMTVDEFENQVSDLCEDNPPAPCASAGGGFLPDGGSVDVSPVISAGLDVSSCPKVPTLDGLTIAFSSKFFQSFDQDFVNLPASVGEQARLKSFCSVVVNLGKMLSDSNLNFFIRGDMPASPTAKIVIVNEPESIPGFKGAQNILQIPATFDGQALAAIESKLAEQKIFFCKGKSVLGGCWFKGEIGKSCDEVCSAAGGWKYDELTKVAGVLNSSNPSSVEQKNCTDVAKAFNGPACFPGGGCTGSGTGCVWRQNDNNTFICAAGPTDSTSRSGGLGRYCACNKN